MIDAICLDKSFSTTRLLTKEKPIIKNSPEDKFETVLFFPEGENRKGEGGLRTKGYFKKSYDDKPLLSIITVVFNGEAYLEETIQSVIGQTYNNVEYIIIDGGSTDGTLDIIKKYEEQIDYWVSEKDDGIYGAMNKGLMLSMGEIIGIINADDYYVEDAIEKSIKALQTTGQDYSIGNIKKIPSNIISKPIHPLIENKIYSGMMYPHIAAFIRADMYKTIGLFDTKYRIAADFDMALRIHMKQFKSVKIDKTIAIFSDGGISSDVRAKKENLIIMIAHGKPWFSAYMSYSIQLLKYVLVKYLPYQFVALIFKYRKSRFQYEK